MRSKYSGKRLFITGATGTLGRELYAVCKELGITAVLLLRKNNQANLFDDDCEYVIGQLPHFGSRSEDILTLSKCDAVVHAAASIAGESKEKMLATNVQGTKAMLQAAFDAQIDRFVYISSIAAYGMPKEKKIINEDEPITSEFDGNVYMQTKAESERLVMEYASKGLSFSIARPGAIYSQTDRWLIKNLYRVIKLRLPLPIRTYNPFPAISAKSLAIQLIEQAFAPKAKNQAFNAIDKDPRPFCVLAEEAADAWGMPTPRFTVPTLPIRYFANIISGMPIKKRESFFTPYSVEVIFNAPVFATSKRDKLLKPKLDEQKRIWKTVCKQWQSAN